MTGSGLFGSGRIRIQIRCTSRQGVLYNCYYIGLLGPGDQGREGATNVSERVGFSPSPGSGMHATAYFRGNKYRRKVLTDMLFSICRVAFWHRDINLWNRYIVYRISFNITNGQRAMLCHVTGSMLGPILSWCTWLMSVSSSGVKEPWYSL